MIKVIFLLTPNIYNIPVSGGRIKKYNHTSRCLSCTKHLAWCGPNVPGVDSLFHSFTLWNCVIVLPGSAVPSSRVLLVKTLCLWGSNGKASSHLWPSLQKVPGTLLGAQLLFWRSAQPFLRASWYHSICGGGLSSICNIVAYISEFCLQKVYICYGILCTSGWKGTSWVLLLKLFIPILEF